MDLLNVSQYMQTLPSGEKYSFFKMSICTSHIPHSESSKFFLQERVKIVPLKVSDGMLSLSLFLSYVPL